MLVCTPRGECLFFAENVGGNYGCLSVVLVNVCFKLARYTRGIGNSFIERKNILFSTLFFRNIFLFGDLSFFLFEILSNPREIVLSIYSSYYSGSSLLARAKV